MDIGENKLSLNNLYNSRLLEFICKELFNYYDFSEGRKRIINEMFLYKCYDDLSSNQKISNIELNKNDIKALVDIYDYFILDDIPNVKKVINNAIKTFKFDEEEYDIDMIGNKIMMADTTLQSNEKINALCKIYGKEKTLNFIANNLYVFENIYPISNKIIEYYKYKYNLINDAYFAEIKNISFPLKKFDSSIKGNWIIKLPPSIEIITETISKMEKTKDVVYLILYYGRFGYLLEESRLYKNQLEEQQKLEECYSYNIFMGYKVVYNSQFKFVIIRS